MSPHKPTVIDLFSGAGGFSLGFHAAGCRILAAVDIDEMAGRSFAANFSELQPDHAPDVYAGTNTKKPGDLVRFNLTELRKKHQPDILIGGPPCQGFSRVGRGKLASLSEDGYAGDIRNTLYERFMEAAEVFRPKAVVMENVPGMQSVDGESVADAAAEDLIRRGYRVGYAALNVVWYGVPQFRERLFFVGIRKDLGINPSLPPTTHHAALPTGYSRPETALFLPFEDLHHELSINTSGAHLPATTVSDALGDLPVIKDHLDGSSVARGDFRENRSYRKGATVTSYARLMRDWPGTEKRRHRRSVDDHVVRRTPRDYETFRRMKPGDRYTEARQIARELFAAELDRLRKRGRDTQPGSPEYDELERSFVPPYPEHMFKDKWRKLVPDQPSWTVPAHLAKDGYSHIHYDGDQARSISVREAARLQSFPDGFRFAGNMGDCFRQIGNAVPPVAAWAIASHLLEALDFRATPLSWEPPTKRRRTKAS